MSSDSTSCPEGQLRLGWQGFPVTPIHALHPNLPASLNVVTPQIVDDKRLPETDDVQIKLEDAEHEGLANIALVKEPATLSSLYTFICPFYVKTDQSECSEAVRLGQQPQI